MMFRMMLLAVAAVLAAMGPAWADAIDGQWCFAGSSLEIQGPRIRTPGGHEISGTYSRHDFSYVVPANEPGGGSEVNMVLLSEDTLTLTRGPAAPETWRRCKPTS